MSIPEEKRHALIQYRIEQAKETAEEANLLIKHNKFRAAINRIYYAMFYMLLALGLKYHFETSKHRQLLGWFNKTFIKNGRANYIMGYHPLFMLVKCGARIFRKPYVTAAVGLFYGFFRGYLKREDQLEDRELIRYLRQQQLRRLFFRPSIWK